MQQFVPLSTTAEDGAIDFEIVARLEDKKKKTGMETKFAVRPDEANLQVGGAASKVCLTHGELYMEPGGFTAAISFQALIHYNRKCVLYVPVVNTVNVAVINKSHNVITRHPAVIFQHHGIHNRR